MTFLLAGVAIVAAPFVVLAFLLSLWARSVSKRTGSAGARVLSIGIWIGGAVASLGGFAMGGIHLLGSSGTEPALKSKMVADAIAEGMNCAAFFLLVVLAVGFLRLVSLEIQARVTARRRSSTR